MRRAAKKDANHNTIGDGLRAAGYSVMDLSHAGRGVPDMAVGKAPDSRDPRGWACLVECKDGSKPPSKRVLTKDELRVLEQWTGPYIVAYSLEDALAKIEKLRGIA